MRDWGDNQPPMPGVFPDYAAPVILKSDSGEREMRDLRWGMPSSKRALLDAATRRADKLRPKGKPVDFAELLKLEPDKGTTNIRNTSSVHWRPHLGPQNRCMVPFTSFCEPDQVGGSLQPIWFALSPERPLAFLAGVWKRDHSCVRKVAHSDEAGHLFRSEAGHHSDFIPATVPI